MNKKLVNEINNYRRYMKHMGFLVEQEDEGGEENIDDLNLEPTTADDAVADDSITGEVGAEDIGGDLGADDMSGEEGDDMALGGDTEEEPVEDTEEVDVTDLVDGQKKLESKFEDTEKKMSDTTTKVDGMFSKLDDLEAKIGELNQLYDAMNNLSAKIEASRPKKPEEKLELRSLDSYPFNQKLTDYFRDKEPEMELSGKNDYVLTSDDVEQGQTSDVAKSFTPPV